MPGFLSAHALLVAFTLSLSIAHFIRLRSEAHAQWEIQQYAAAVRTLAETLYPVALPALLAAE